MSTEAKYADVRAALRKAVAEAEDERPWELYRASSLVTAALGVRFEHKGGYSREIDHAQSRFYGQVRRALNALAGDGTLVKDDTRGKLVEYLPPALYAQRRAERDRHFNEMLERDERSAAQRHRLSAFGIDARLQFGEVCLTPDQLDILMDLAAKGLS
jgi:hypothetical protein